jgi:hypothetical protein
MKLYLAGPMTGVPEFNYPLFNEVAAKLRAQGHEVFNPAEEDPGLTYRECMTKDMEYLCKHATCICLLPGWEYSPGAKAEHALACCLKLSIMYWS